MTDFRELIVCMTTNKQILAASPITNLREFPTSPHQHPQKLPPHLYTSRHLL
ncbi:hypothetical protein [Rubritalea tangerina]|uniref:hypothetical protein n=1 Tax=Rubritalea tangerina TaxID=430798 RepID=UPI0036153699